MAIEWLGAPKFNWSATTWKGDKAMAHVPTVADKYRKGLGDTILVCQEYEELTAYYVNGIDYKPHYPVPAIPLSVHFDEGCYAGLVWIDDNRVPDDPVMVYAWDAWFQERPDVLLG